MTLTPARTVAELKELRSATGDEKGAQREANNRRPSRGKSLMTNDPSPDDKQDQA